MWLCTTADGLCLSRSASPRPRPITVQCRSCRWTRDGVSIAAIASGRYDGYLSAYAEAVRAYRHPVILSFGHEMNGTWYSWGYRHTSPAVFVAAWRHIVTLFRALGARNVTWLWTVNIVNDTQHGRIPPPGPVVARQLLRDLGGDRRLLPQAVLAVRSVVRADHRQGARADQRPDTHRRDRRDACRRPASEDRRPVRWHPRSMGCSGSCGSTPRTTNGQDFGINSPAAVAAFRKGASTFTRPGS